MKFVRKSFPVGPLQCNCTVLGDTETGMGYVFDPGGHPQRIMATVAELGLKIIGIVHTHAHLDHFLAAGDIRRMTGAPVWLHRSDQFLWDSLEQQCTSFGVPYIPQPDPDHWLEHEQALECGGVCIHTPGHRPGTTVLLRGRSPVAGGDSVPRPVCPDFGVISAPHSIQRLTA
jgi:glyoxylase-like metal-dependent hydrolase (beta-lactamase superfamily II)